MSPLSIWLKAFWHCARTIARVMFDLVELLRLATKSRSALMAENLFLRKQLAMFQERNVKPHRAQDSARWLMACLSRLFDWRDARGGEAGYSDPMASPRLPLVLALEVQTGGKTRRAQEPPGVDPEDGG
jgi:hypothetical protein